MSKIKSTEKEDIDKMEMLPQKTKPFRKPVNIPDLEIAEMEFVFPLDKPHYLESKESQQFLMAQIASRK